MRIAIAAAVLVLSACGKEPAIATAPAAPPATATIEAQEVVAAEGWETTHPLVGKPTPFFSLQKVEGGEVTRDQLRGRWTILGFWNATLAGVEQETRYLRAL